MLIIYVACREQFFHEWSQMSTEPEQLQTMCRLHSLQWDWSTTDDDIVTAMGSGEGLQQAASGLPPSETGAHGGFHGGMLFKIKQIFRF